MNNSSSPQDQLRILGVFAHPSEESALLRYSSDYCEVSWYPSGCFIIEQGEPACNLYLILSGTVEVMREDPNRTQRVVAHMGPGSFFGEEITSPLDVENSKC